MGSLEVIVGSFGCFLEFVGFIRVVMFIPGCPSGSWVHSCR